MHPLARVFQIIFLLGGIAMFVFALDEANGNGYQSMSQWRYECTTSNTGTTEQPRPKETCESKSGQQYLRGTDEVMVSSLAGLGLMIGAVAVSVGSPRRTRQATPPAAPGLAPGGPQQFAGAPLPGQQPHQVPNQPPAGPPAGPPRSF